MRTGRDSLVRVGLTLATFLVAAPADAHLNATGLGPLYDGATHFLMSPEDWVPVLALALLCGLRGASYGRRALLVLPLAWLVGGLLGLSAEATNGIALVSGVWFVLVGGLLVLDVGLSLRSMSALAAVLGLYHGFFNGAGLGQFATATVALLGLAFAVFVLVGLAAAFAVSLRAPWSRIAVRVAGSWIAASGLLLLAWTVRTA